MKVMLCHSEFSPYAELDAYQQAMPESSGRFGATSVFVGTMRELNLGDEVTGMTLEFYPGMTERRLEGIVADAQNRWELIDALIIHRVGEIKPGDAIVLVAVWTPHRGAAFEACRHIIEALKHTAPFWKKETVKEGERWVESNTLA
jgi:molybdopterin synthase catalytic subunit